MVKTDADGRYTFPIDDESIIFIIKPSGYVVPVDQDLLPRFYYIHQPAASPPNLRLRYRGLDPTGPRIFYAGAGERSRLKPEK
jgi:N terminal of Calcineurin-like phosphoesterase